MYVLIIVTEKVNHTLHFKTKTTGVMAFNNLQTARKVMADAEVRDMYGSYEMEDDHEVKASIRLSSIISTQLADPEEEMARERERKILQMHSDLKLGEAMATDPRLKEAQAREAARSRLVKPPGT